MILFIALAITAPLLVDPRETERRRRPPALPYQPPNANSGSARTSSGRSVLDLLIYGSRISLRSGSPPPCSPCYRGRFGISVRLLRWAASTPVQRLTNWFLVIPGSVSPRAHSRPRTEPLQHHHRHRHHVVGRHRSARAGADAVREGTPLRGTSARAGVERLASRSRGTSCRTCSRSSSRTPSSPSPCRSSRRRPCRCWDSATRTPCRGAASSSRPSMRGRSPRLLVVARPARHRARDRHPLVHDVRIRAGRVLNPRLRER